MANKRRSGNKSLTSANPSSAQTAAAYEANAKPVAPQVDPGPSSAQIAATSTERTWVSLLKPKQQGPSSSAQRDPYTGVSEACAKLVALQVNPRPSSAQEGSSLSAQTATAYVESPSVANTTAAPAPSQ